MRGSTIAALVWLTIVPVAALAASKQEALHGRGTGYLKKRFVGGPFRVIPEAVLEQDLGGDAPWAIDRRVFVVLGPEGYSWRFRYDRASGVPTYRHHVKGGPGSEILEIDAPEALAFEPSREILYGQGLICTNATAASYATAASSAGHATRTTPGSTAGSSASRARTR